MKGLKKKQQEQNLAKNIGKVISLVMIITFILLIVVTAVLVRTSLMRAIDDGVAGNVQNTANQIKSIIDTVERTGIDILTYLEKAYKLEGEGYSNMAKEELSHTDTRAYRSMIYGEIISELNADAEKYVTETARTAVLQNPAIDGIRVMFEPYKYDENIESYAFYINSEIGQEGKIEPFGEYNQYSKESYYQDAFTQKKMVFTDPYEYDGKMLITYATPIFHNGEVNGVIMVDINSNYFKNAVVKNDNYPSMYTTLYNNRYIDIYDSETIEDVGKNMEIFFKDPAELNQIKEKMKQGSVFSMTTQREDGRTLERYYSPIAAAEDTWWAMTALEVNEKNQAVTNIIIVLVLCCVVTLLSIVLLTVNMLRKRLKPIANIVEAAEQISQGKLDIAISIDTNDEIGKLGRAFQITIERLNLIISDIDYLLDEMADGNYAIKTTAEESYIGKFNNILLSMRKLNRNMSKTLMQIVEGTEQVSIGSTQMAEGAQSLAEGATEQAGAVQELTATIENIASIAEQGAKNAIDAYERVYAASEEATKGQEDVNNLTVAMERINQTSKEIQNIIGTIEDIASQTNLLSLNASIEAARAGEAGRGFGVVADQIGKLAADSARSAVDTKELIIKTLDEIEKGNEITQKTAELFEGLILHMQRFGTVAKESSESSNSQAEMLKQAQQGVEQISSVVQTNSAAAEETSATSEELSAQAESLRGLVEKFQLTQK